MFNFASTKLSHISVDCIKTCPFEENLFAFAYYQTNPDTQGAIAVAKLEHPEDIHHIQPIQSPPLLHMVWARAINNHKYILAAASRTNDVLIYEYDSKEKALTLSKTLQIGQSIFCLYLDMKTLENNYRLLVSSNQSTVVDILLDLNFDILEKKLYSKHEYAVWTCRLHPESNAFVCGDEVNTIYLYNDGQLVAKNKKAHTAGICDLTFAKGHTLYTGGFDGIICTLDLRKFGECVYRQDWGGTIWRVLPNQTETEILLCNSSQKKFQIVDTSLSKQLWNSEASHESLAYAADWGKNSLITASFYDKKLCYWNRGI